MNFMNSYGVGNSNIHVPDTDWTMTMFREASRLRNSTFYPICLKREKRGWRALFRSLKLRGAAKDKANAGARRMAAKWIRDNIGIR